MEGIVASIMRAETKYIDGDVHISIYNSKDKLLCRFKAEFEKGDEEFIFGIQTPYTAQSIIHTADCYTHIPEWRGWNEHGQ